MIVGNGDWITAEDLPARLSDNGSTDPAFAGDDLKSAMRIYERNHIGNVLERVDGDKRQAADLLGISLSSLYRKIEELEVAHE